MSEVAIIERPKSVLIDMATRYGMEPAAFELTVRATCMRPDKDDRVPSREEFAAFLLVAKEYKLNPLTKEIYAFSARGGGIVPIVSIDGWVNLVNSHGACDGFEFDMEHDDKGNLVSCTCRMYRKDRTHPVTVTEYLSECSRNTEPWKMKHRMLRHKSLIQAARYAFGFSGIYDEDEGAKIADMRDVTPRDSGPPSPPPPETASPPVVPVDGEGEVVEKTEPVTAEEIRAANKLADSFEQEEHTVASLYEDSAQPQEAVVLRDNGPPSASALAAAAKPVEAKPAKAAKPAVAKPIEAAQASNDDIPSFLDRRGSPEIDRQKGNFLRDIDTLDGLDDYVIWMRDAAAGLKRLPEDPRTEVNKAFASRLKSKLIGQIKLLEDANGFQEWAADSRDARNLLPTGDQVDVNQAFSLRQKIVHEAGR